MEGGGGGKGENCDRIVEDVTGGGDKSESARHNTCPRFSEFSEQHFLSPKKKRQMMSHFLKLAAFSFFGIEESPNYLRDADLELPNLETRNKTGRVKKSYFSLRGAAQNNSPTPPPKKRVKKCTPKSESLFPPPPPPISAGSLMTPSFSPRKKRSKKSKGNNKIGRETKASAAAFQGRGGDSR